MSRTHLLLSLPLTLALTACPGDPGDTDVGPDSTGIVLTSATTGSSGDPTGTGPSTSTGPDDSTTGDATTGDPPTSLSDGATTLGPDQCPKSDDCTVTAPDFCSAVAQIATNIGLKQQTIGIILDHCADEEPCWVCWDLVNTCQQSGQVPDVSVCEQVELECGCVAAAFGGNP